MQIKQKKRYNYLFKLLLVAKALTANYGITKFLIHLVAYKAQFLASQSLRLLFLMAFKN